MSERDRIQQAIDDLEPYWGWPPKQRAAAEAALRDAHARGLREGAAAERQRCAGVCEAKRADWEMSAEGTASPPHAEAWRHMAGAARMCRDDVLRDPGAGSAETPTPHGPPAPVRRICPCGGEYRPLKKDHFPVPLSACIKCGADGPPWPDVVGEPPAAQPHGPPVTANPPNPVRGLYEGGHVQPDPNPPVCGTCVLWLPWLRAPGGYCRVVREKDINDRTDTADLTVTTAAHACDIGEWRAKGEGV